MSRQVTRVSRRAKHDATPPHQVIEQVLRIMVYRGTSGCRVLVSTNWQDHGSRAHFLASSAIRYQRVRSA